MKINLKSYFRRKDSKKNPLLYYVIINGKSETTAPSVYELNTQEWLKVHRFINKLLKIK